MIIHPLAPKFENGEIVRAARIELGTPHTNLPETLWFKFPEEEAAFVSERGDGFAVALLFLALRLGETLELRGTLSPRLAEGMCKYQKRQISRNPRALKEIEIRADGYAPTEPSRGKSASALSGGVDSTYTLWSHVRQNERSGAKPLSYAMFVHGLDIGLHDERSYELCKEGFRQNYGAWGIRLLTPRTNVRAFSDGDTWEWENQVALSALGHMYGKELERLYLATSSYFGQAKAGRANPLYDELLSTESLRLIGDGADTTKYQRIETIARVPATYECLRVCNVKQDGLFNCCECDKCVSTMTALDLVGALPLYKTFPKLLTRNKIRFSRASYFLINNHKSFLRAAVRQRRYDRALDIGFKLGWNYFRWGGVWVKRRFMQGM